MKPEREIQVFLRGGLGNQLFQYSTGIALTTEHRRELVLRGDLLPKAEDSIGTVSRWPNQIIEFHHSGIIRTKSYQPVGKTNFLGKFMQSMRLAGDRFPNMVSRIGWLASENSEPTIELHDKGISIINSYAPYKDLAFRNREKLSAELNQVRSPSKEFLDLVTKIENSSAIAVHIRQGDYLKLSHIYGSYSLPFLRAALQDLRETTNLKKIWLFTDTPSAIPNDVYDFLNPDRVIGPEGLTRPLENMLLMSKAVGLIAANSSFSWWSAFLTQPGTPVVAPYIVSAAVNNFSKDSELDQNWRVLVVK